MDHHHEEATEIASMPLSTELLLYYKQRVEAAERDLEDAMKMVDTLRPAHDELHRLRWELQARTGEIADLQRSLSQCHLSLLEERKKLLQVTNENDALRIQEIKDRKKMRHLLNMSTAGEDETTYFREKVPKKIVRPYRGGGGSGEEALSASGKSSSRHLQATSSMSSSQAFETGSEQQPDSVTDGSGRGRSRRSHGAGRHDERGDGETESAGGLIGTDGEDAESDDPITLRLTISALRAELDEKEALYRDHIHAFEADRSTREQEMKQREDAFNIRMEEQIKKTQQLQNLLRENIKDMLHLRRESQMQERTLKEEKAKLMEQLSVMRHQLEGEKVRSNHVEKSIEARVSKKNEGLVGSLRQQLLKSEDEIRNFKSKIEFLEASYEKKVAFLQDKIDRMSSSYKALKRRRDYEIEGFTNDITILRQQLKSLERHIVKYGPLEEQELLLLTLARNTGRKASKLSGELHDIKSKVYGLEDEMRKLAF